LLINAAKWAERFLPKAWQALLRQADEETIVERLRRATRTGRSVASDSVLAKLETKLNRRVCVRCPTGDRERRATLTGRSVRRQGITGARWQRGAASTPPANPPEATR